MFYSEGFTGIYQNISQVSPSQVFIGQYWDEFGLVCHLVPDESEVLMLGLGYGGGIRPIFSSKNNYNLTCVDLNVEYVDKCSKLFDDHFPKIRFRAYQQDAIEFLKLETRFYDCIWVDVYQPEAYCDFVLKEDFYSLLRSRLGQGGVVFVNSYGLPNQFEPLRQSGPQSYLSQVLKAQFSFVGAIPYRRNITFVAADQRPRIRPVQPHADLNSLDRLSLQTMRLKLEAIQEVGSHLQSSQASIEAKDLLFSEIDKKMRAGWLLIMEELGKFGAFLTEPKDLLNLIQNQILCEKILNNLEGLSTPVRSFFPILCASESSLNPINVAWILNWTLENWHRLKSTDPVLYQTIWLPQMWALVCQESGQYKSYCFQIYGLIDKERV